MTLDANLTACAFAVASFMTVAGPAIEASHPSLVLRTWRRSPPTLAEYEFIWLAYRKHCPGSH